MKATTSNDTDSPGQRSDERFFDMHRHEPQQPALFVTEDLIIPETVGSLRKAISALHAFPASSSYNHTLNNRRLFDACILVAQLECRRHDAEWLAQIKDPAIRRSPMFEVRITDLARLANIPGKNYERIYDMLRELFRTEIRWNILGEDKSVEFDMMTTFFSTLGFGKHVKRGLIRFAFDPAVLSFLLEPSLWATLSLHAGGKLGTPASYALYQNTFRYLGTHAKVTAALPTETWIELLTGKSRYVVEDPLLGKKINYGEFKRRVLLDAIARVNECKALSHTLQLKELRSGNRVASLQFKFLPKEQLPLELPMSWPTEVITVLENMGYTAPAVAELSQGHSLELVAEALARLKLSERRLREQGKPLTSRRAYFEGILRNMADGAAANELNDELIAAEVKQQEAKRAAEARQARIKEEFAKHQKECFITWLFALPPEERSALVTAVLASEETAAPAIRSFFAKELTPTSMSALAVLRTWHTKAHPEKQAEIYANPEDQTFEAWMAWRLEQAGA